MPVHRIVCVAGNHMHHSSGEQLMCGRFRLSAEAAQYGQRGYLHEAYSRDETSAHLTIGILSHTWRDVLQAVFDRTIDEVAFRESVPIGFARDTEAFATARS